MQSRLALRYLDQLLRERAGQSFNDWVKERRPAQSWYQIALELAQVTKVSGAAPETIRRWYEKPL